MADYYNSDLFHFDGEPLSGVTLSTSPSFPVADSPYLEGSDLPSSDVLAQPFSDSNPSYSDPLTIDSSPSSTPEPVLSETYTDPGDSRMRTDSQHPDFHLPLETSVSYSAPNMTFLRSPDSVSSTSEASLESLQQQVLLLLEQSKVLTQKISQVSSDSSLQHRKPDPPSQTVASTAQLPSQVYPQGFQQSTLQYDHSSQASLSTQPTHQSVTTSSLSSDQSRAVLSNITQIPAQAETSQTFPSLPPLRYHAPAAQLPQVSDLAVPAPAYEYTRRAFYTPQYQLALPDILPPGVTYAIPVSGSRTVILPEHLPQAVRSSAGAAIPVPVPVPVSASAAAPAPQPTSYVTLPEPVQQLPVAGAVSSAQPAGTFYPSSPAASRSSPPPQQISQPASASGLPFHIPSMHTILSKTRRSAAPLPPMDAASLEQLNMHLLQFPPAKRAVLERKNKAYLLYYFRIFPTFNPQQRFRGYFKANLSRERQTGWISSQDFPDNVFCDLRQMDRKYFLIAEPGFAVEFNVVLNQREQSVFSAVNVVVFTVNEVQPDERERYVCVYFASGKGCKKGYECPFLHILPNGIPVTASNDIQAAQHPPHHHHIAGSKTLDAPQHPLPSTRASDLTGYSGIDTANASVSGTRHSKKGDTAAVAQGGTGEAGGSVFTYTSQPGHQVHGREGRTHAHGKERERAVEKEWGTQNGVTGVSTVYSSAGVANAEKEGRRGEGQIEGGRRRWTGAVEKTGEGVMQRYASSGNSGGGVLYTTGHPNPQTSTNKGSQAVMSSSSAPSPNQETTLYRAGSLGGSGGQ